MLVRAAGRTAGRREAAGSVVGQPSTRLLLQNLANTRWAQVRGHGLCCVRLHAAVDWRARALWEQRHGLWVVLQQSRGSTVPALELHLDVTLWEIKHMLFIAFI